MSRPLKDATTILASLEGGQVMQSFSTEIEKALLHLNDLAGDRPKSKAKGKLTLSINLVVEQGTATIEAEIIAKLPKAPRGSSFYWVTSDGGLSTNHPKQLDLLAGPREVTRAAE